MRAISFVLLLLSLHCAPSAQQLSVRKGLAWLIDFNQKEKNFHFVFSDYLQILYELSLSSDGVVRQGATDELHRSIDRSRGSLAKIFEPDLTDKWDYISIMPFLSLSGKFDDTFRNFYASYFPKSTNAPSTPGFYEAIDVFDYDTLSDYLIDHAYLELLYQLPERSRGGVALPKNRFGQFMQKIEKLALIRVPDDDLSMDEEMPFSDQNYYLTHVVFAMANYGYREIEPSPFTARMLTYLQKYYKTVWRDESDIDLFAEFVHSRLMLGDDREALTHGVDFLVKMQHKDGSWGTAEDREGDPYDIMHPTWAAATAIDAYESR